LTDPSCHGNEIWRILTGIPHTLTYRKDNVLEPCTKQGVSQVRKLNNVSPTEPRLALAAMVTKVKYFESIIDYTAIYSMIICHIPGL